MPGKNRFGGGSLLGPVQPLPDDDEPTPAPEPEPAAAAPPVPEPPPAPEPEPAPVVEVPEAREEEPSPPAVTPAAETLRGRAGPPSTLRINEPASAALWTAYLEAKTADPFLSFRQFASGVVLDGLQRAEQRAARRRR